MRRPLLLLAGISLALTFAGAAQASTLPCVGSDVIVAQEFTTVRFCPPPLTP